MSRGSRFSLLRPAASFKAKYGSNPLHLLLIVAMGALAGFAVLHWLHAPTPIRLLVWFAAAVVGHDLIAFPIYTGLDRLLIRAIAGSDPGPVIGKWRRAAINHLRAPALVSVLLLIMWYPIIFRRSDAVYFRASGQHENRYLGNWLLVVAILFGASLLIYLGRLAYAAGRSRISASPPENSLAESTTAQPEPGTNQP
jgi:hypothetical protein